MAINILVIDPNTHSLHATQKILDQSGYSCQAKETLIEALYDSSPEINLIVLNIGKQQLCYIPMLKKRYAHPLIVISADGISRSSINLGADSYLQVPYFLSQLTDSIDQLGLPD